MTWAQLGKHQKPVLIANIGGFWDALIHLIDQMRRERFIRAGMEVSCLVAHDAAEIVPMLKRATAERPQAALEQTAAAAPIDRM
jgi:predicted Rossmann-fold nucleotide-binding protein